MCQAVPDAFHKMHIFGEEIQVPAFLSSRADNVASVSRALSLEGYISVAAGIELS